MSSHSPVIRKEMAIKLLKNERHPFVSEFRMTHSSVQKYKQQSPVNTPIVQNLLSQCRFLEELVIKSRNIISEKEQKVQILLQVLKQRDLCCKELQQQNHKLMEERQILIEHITSLEQQLNIEEDDGYSHDGQYQNHMANLNDLRHFLSQIRQSNEDLPIFMDVDGLTYEQLLQLEDTIGYVNRGLTDEQIKQIPKIPFSELQADEQLCSVCQIEFDPNDKCRTLPCQHIYHSKCIKTWLRKEKQCPICKQEIVPNITNNNNNNQTE